MNLKSLLQKLTVFFYKTIYLEYIYEEAKVKIFNSLNICLQDVLELTPAIDLITFFAFQLFLLNSPLIPPNSISNHRRA
jgi:hypothetical protein